MSFSSEKTILSDYRGPLEGLKVIDFGHYYAGPMAAMMLADQGATVIRIVRPEGKELPEHQFRLFNRNKKLLQIDLKNEAHKNQILSLIENADVIIESFRPGVMKRLGLDYASVKDKNPGLIYLSLPGFASTDKERAHIQAWEGVVGAATGLYTDTHLQRETLHFPPVYTAVPLRSMYAGANGAVAVMASLLAREKHGFGTLLEVPLADSGLISIQLHLTMKRPFFALRTGIDDRSDADAVPESFLPLMFDPQDSRKIQEEKLEKARHLTMTNPVGRSYRCADGRDIWIGTFFAKHIVASLLKVLGIEKQVLQEGFINEGGWICLGNNISAMTGLSSDRKQRLEHLMKEAFLTRSSEDWETRLTNAGVLAAVIRTRQEWLSLQPLLASGVFTQQGEGEAALVTPGRAGDITGPGGALISGYREAESISAVEAVRLFGQPNVTKSPQGERPVQNKGELLRGLKVLDLANVVAGPMGSQVLAEYGAEVIEATHPNSYPFPGVLGARWMTHSGKRSILTEVGTAPGRGIFNRLVSWADVVTHNILDLTAQRLGATHAQLQAINPNVVSCQVSAYGGTYRGGWENRPGYDWSLHAAAGQMTQFGSLEQPHIHGEGSTADIVAGFTLAFTALIGVWQQRKTGYAGEGRTSLAQAINYSELPNMIAQQGQCNWGISQGQFALGNHWWQRLYQCADGWIYVGVSEARKQILSEIVIGQPEANQQALEREFTKRSCAEWQDSLTKADIGCHSVWNAEDMLAFTGTVRDVSNEAADEFAERTLDIVRWPDHSYGRPIIAPAPTWVRVGEQRTYRRLSPPPKVGENTREILLAIGYSEKEVDEFIRLKISHEYLPPLGKKAFLFEPE